jgi:hypothetical protein
MMNEAIGRPDTTEYLSYYGNYISMVPDGDILAVLESQMEDTAGFLGTIPESQASFRYAPDKWSIKEVVGHLIDGERVFAYRALRFARNDKTPLPGFEQDDYVRNGAFDNCRLSDLAAELKSVRQATLFLFNHLDRDAWTRRGVANDDEVSVRALAYIIAGHELHHREVLRTKYLSSASASGS